MKHLRSSIEDMRRLFDRGITVRDIAESFVSFDDGQSALEIRSFLESKDYDVVGVRRKGMIEAYALRSELGEGKLGDFEKTVEPGTQLSDSTALLSVFELLRNRRWVFVNILDRVWGIVTRGDLHKAPVRMWIFCLISLAEMHTLRIVRNRYPNEGNFSTVDPNSNDQSHSRGRLESRPREAQILLGSRAMLRPMPRQGFSLS